MALVRHPTAAISRVSLGLGVNPNDLFDSDMAITTNPENYLTPRFRIDCAQRHDGWYATVVVEQNATEGANISRYLGTGMFTTGRMSNGMGGVTNFIPGPNRRQIWVEVSQAMANLNRAAEQEHCDDMLRAYTLTLGAVQAALDHAAVNLTGPHLSRAAAMTAAQTAIDGGLHARLQTIVRNAIDVNNATVDNARFRTDLGAIYDETCALSNTERDGRGFHTFMPAAVESRSLWSWTEWTSRTVLPSYRHTALFGDQKDIRALVTGPRFQVPGPLTNVIIHL